MIQDKANVHDMQKIFLHLPLFAQLNPQQISDISAGAQINALQKGETLFQKGDPCQGLYIVLSGQIKLAFRSIQGGEKVVEIIGQNQSFGEAVMFLNRPYPLHAEALEESLLIHIASTPIFELLDRDSSFARNMLAGLSIRLHSLIQDVESYSLCSSMQRVIGYLLEHCQQENEVKVEVSLPTSKLIIASRLNLTPETLSRVFNDLSKAGLITVLGKQITIHDLRKMREFGL